MTDAGTTHQADLSEPAHDEPAPVSSELIDERAKRIAAEVRADMNKRTAETAEAGLKQAVGERDALSHRNEELARQTGRLEGVNEVLKEELQQKLQATPPTFDQTPVIQAINGMRDDLKKVVDKIEQPAPQPTVVVPPVVEKVQPKWRERYRTSYANLLRPIIWIPGLILILLIVYALWQPASKMFGELFAQITHHEDAAPPPDNTPAPEQPIASNQPSGWSSEFDGEINDAPPVTTPPVTTGDVEQDFRSDCAAHGGQVYTAEDWNAANGSDLSSGQMHCNAPAHWEVDP